MGVRSTAVTSKLIGKHCRSCDELPSEFAKIGIGHCFQGRIGLDYF